VETDLPDIERPSRPFTLVGIAFTGIAAGALIGATTNAVNGFVSPTYFINILHWQNVENVPRACIAQGIFEGLLFGFFFSLIFTVATAYFTGAASTYQFAAKHLLGIVIGAYASWILGGISGMGLATLSPEFFRGAFIGVPENFADMLPYAWVGGSIWGAQFGGFFCLFVGIIFLRANWRRDAGRRR
jgi:hypothetical protein